MALIIERNENQFTRGKHNYKPYAYVRGKRVIMVRVFASKIEVGG